MTKRRNGKVSVETLRHADAKRTNIPTAEFQSVMTAEQQAPMRVSYPRTAAGLAAEKAARNRDLDPQLVWRGKDALDWSDLVVAAPPLYIQEKVHPKVLIDDLERAQRETRKAPDQIDLFADFNGVPDGDARTEFYRHDAHWSNRMILGDSLQVMASLAEREGLRGKVQCIYLDPPYGIRFNSNFQWSTTSRDVKDGNVDHITREPEQVKAFRDTWRDGIHSYLTYLRDRLTVARDLLTESGSIFVQIGDENVHRVRAVLDEVFGQSNFIAQIAFRKTTSQTSDYMAGVCDYLLMYARDGKLLKYRPLYLRKSLGGAGTGEYQFLEDIAGQMRRLNAEEVESETLARSAGRVFSYDNLTSQRPPGDFSVEYQGRQFRSGAGYWKTGPLQFPRLLKAGRALPTGSTLKYKRFLDDFPVMPIANTWNDTSSGASSTDPKRYVVQTASRVVERSILMSTDPGDLVLDPTCGSGTTAYVAEQWGRRWITIDTSRVALALARARIMGARYPYYLLADSPEGQRKEAEASGAVPKSAPTHGSVRQGFVYERVPHVTLKSIANNAEIDVIWERWQATLEPLRATLNKALRQSFEEWQIPREADKGWPKAAHEAHAAWWQARIARQQEIDASIAAKAEFEFLYDRPYEDRRKVRVAGPFTVESVSPHRTLAVDENDELVDRAAERSADYASGAVDERDFTRIILENLRAAGVQQVRKADRIAFTSLTAWPGDLVCAEGRYAEGGEDGRERRAAIFIGPEFGTVTRADLVEAAREAAEAGFHLLIACAFSYEARTTEFDRLGKLPVLKARMNADLHMADDLKTTSKGNLFVVFGEPDIDVLRDDDGRLRVKVNGVDVFHPNSGEVRSDGPDGIACWFVDTDYDEESFFVRHAYFLGANDPYKALKTTLKAEIDADAWASLHSDTSRPFDKPASGRIAVKVINHLGDEVMKVFKV